MTIVNYTRAFTLLERHAYMLTKDRKVATFVGGIYPTIKTLVNMSGPTTFETTKDRALQDKMDLGFLKPSHSLGYLGLTNSTFSMGTNTNTKPYNKKGKEIGKG